MEYRNRGARCDHGFYKELCQAEGCPHAPQERDKQGILVFKYASEVYIKGTYGRRCATCGRRQFKDTPCGCDKIFDDVTLKKMSRRATKYCNRSDDTE